MTTLEEMLAVIAAGKALPEAIRFLHMVSEHLFVKPAGTLLTATAESASDVIKAYGKSKADEIRTKSDLALKDIRDRYALRVEALHFREQENIETVVIKAAQLIKAGATPESMDPDWMANFFDKVRLFSNTDMQGVWARILAGEANSKGAFSKRTINILADMEKSDADAFEALCRLVWDINGPMAFVTDVMRPALSSVSIIQSSPSLRPWA